jgi:hypothetical protein
MMFTKFYTAIFFLAVALMALAACSDREEERVVETAVAQASPTMLPTNTAVPTPTITATPIPPTLTATATAVPEASDQPQPFLVEAFDFELTVPAGYVVVEREHADALLVVSLHEVSVMADERIHKPEIFVTVHHNSGNLSVQEWFEAHTAESVTEGYPLYVNPRNVQTEQIAGRPAITFEDMTLSHGYVTLIEAETYILLLGFVPFDYPGLAEAYAVLIDSLAFGDSAAVTEPPSAPVALCPDEAAQNGAWTCEETSRDGTRYCTAVDPEQNLACYEDLDHFFALLLPVDWVTDTTVYQRFSHRPYPPSQMMVKDHQIIIYDDDKRYGDGVTIVRIFVPVDRTITSWLTHRQRSNPGQVSQTRTDITVAGQPGAIWLNDCSPQYYREVHIAVHNGERVFWWQHYAYNEASIVALRQMLDSLRFGEETAVPAEIPDDIWQEALRGCQ